MNSRAAPLSLLPAEPAVALPLWQEAAAVAGRIAAQLRANAAGDEADDAAWRRVLAFLDGPCAHAQTTAELPVEHALSAAVEVAAQPQALDTLAQALHLSADERLLLVLAGMADEHEGHAAAFAALHPRGESRPSWGLFARLIARDAGRSAAWELLHASPLLRLGVVRLTGGDATPLPERSLQLADGLWPALHGLPAWPAGVAPLPASSWLDDTDDWLAQPNTQSALTRLRAGAPAAVLLRGAQPAALRLRAQQLAAAGGGFVFEWDAARHDAPMLSAVLAHCLLRGAVPVLLTSAPLPPAHWALLDAWPLPLALAGAAASQAHRSPHRLLALDARPLAPAAQHRLWLRALPELAPHAELLAALARHPAHPETLLQLRQDLAPWLAGGSAVASNQPPPLDRCIAALKARTATADDSFARRVQPAASWSDLVLPPDKLALLHGAVARMRLQRQVLDDWGFGNRAGGIGNHNRGLRLLFSGLPGTGKTLAAEVMAHALHAELLVIDLARLVSKWVGETEKNLATAFEQAEGSGTVLFFDEADALFGKRTEVGDAHDRYANIESAYLLARLERFDGIAILATNLRGNLDRAFMRRFEVVLDFTEPGPAERAAIWRRQFPAQAPLASDVDIDALAALHALPGALIRNAALGAAFIAAAEGDAGRTPIQRRHVEQALRQEYEKSGRVCPL